MMLKFTLIGLVLAITPILAAPSGAPIYVAPVDGDGFVPIKDRDVGIDVSLLSPPEDTESQPFKRDGGTDVSLLSTGDGFVPIKREDGDDFVPIRRDDGHGFAPI
jgi:hypothetical protein